MTQHHQDQCVVTNPEMNFGFDNEDPTVYIHHAGSYKRSIKVDPAPAYTHNADRVLLELRKLQEHAPLPIPLAIWLLDQEPVGRTNGTYYDEIDYSGDTAPYPHVGIIVLSGKRIPIHPAMTRYLVSHEYGHGVMYHLAVLRGLKDERPLLDDYKKRCRPDTSTDYGCGRWHANVGELFANDFRMLVMRSELEFWPHLSKKPQHVDAVVDYWAEVCTELKWSNPILEAVRSSEAA